ncbi:hypothetical protein CI1B_03770 [Bradyrhizobium ivorense]|uniref:Uncharacterized protein n=1 Tax=Bradyrhizobium ivorense TaxID=2511166 RepID=A0A508SS85_9BRAD|nr:hypothetical protein [Bradyrhizobium ivorense]VIO65279.1 hypothetical protein CI1B_03770 [Bradyrhizobium ivorense]VIO67268.1 hypothetical protein CI41S_06320 [Bradyrhizobium ivorense]
MSSRRKTPLVLAASMAAGGAAGPMTFPLTIWTMQAETRAIAA